MDGWMNALHCMIVYEIGGMHELIFEIWGEENEGDEWGHGILTGWLIRSMLMVIMTSY